VVAYVLKLGQLAYKDKGKFNGGPWCQAKDWVLIGRYAGARFKLEDGAEIRIINDDEVIGTILSPDDIHSL
jgi:co-chaperonin GroES (HSP10)